MGSQECVLEEGDGSREQKCWVTGPRAASNPCMSRWRGSMLMNEVLAPAPQKATISGVRVFTEVLELNWGA